VIVRRSGRERGQALVEFAVLVPAFLIILLSLLEFGLVFNQYLTLEYATREGARVASALADGDDNPTICSQVDPQSIAAVQRVLTSPGSQVNEAEIQEIRIWRSTLSSSGTPGVPDTNARIYIWTYVAPAPGPTVDGQPLLFNQTSTTGGAAWPPCSRNDDGANPESIGVSLTYRYQMTTPLTGLLRLVGGPGATQITITDKTVMSLNPSG
jgi:hypothetical protein